MSFRKYAIIVDKVTGRKRVRSYDVRVACEQYANIAGVLAGFAFTIIVLVAQENKPSLTEIEILRRNVAAIGFFVAFFGFITASFVFAIIAGEEELTPRANQMAFFAGAGFSLNMSLLFWSIANFLRSFLVEKVAVIAYQMFPLFVILSPIFVVSSLLDNIHIFDRRKPILKEYFILLFPSILTIAIAWLFRIIGLTFKTNLNFNVFNTVIWLFLLTIIIDNIFSATSSTLHDDYRINISFSGFWIWMHSTFISALILLT